MHGLTTLHSHHVTCHPSGVSPRAMSIVSCENDVSVTNVHVCVIIVITFQSPSSGVMPPSCGTSQSVLLYPSICGHSMSVVYLVGRCSHAKNAKKHSEDEMSNSRRWRHRHVRSVKLAWRMHTDSFRSPRPFRIYGYAPQINGATYK